MSVVSLSLSARGGTRRRRGVGGLFPQHLVQHKPTIPLEVRPDKLVRQQLLHGRALRGAPLQQRGHQRPERIGVEPGGQWRVRALHQKEERRRQVASKTGQVPAS